MSYGWKVELTQADVTTDITAQVARFEITARLDQYCRELSIDLADPDLYASFDFSQLPAEPELEVFTRIATEWISQGQFFVERPTFEVGLHSTMTGIWGRSITARLGPPFSVKVSPATDAQTTFFAVCAELCAAAGVAWDDAYCEIDDFVIFPGTWPDSGGTQNAYAIELMNELAGFVGALITTDRAGHVCVKTIDYAPSSAVASITDAVVQRLSEPVEWPDFGNRIKISAAGGTGGYGVELIIPNPCLPLDVAYKIKIYARVTDQDAEPVNELPVSWSIAHDIGVLEASTTNTQPVLIADEEVRAKSFYEIDVAFPPSSVIGVYSYKDTAKSVNLTAGGYELDGNTITLSQKLTYCDQSLKVSYVVQGVAVNFLAPGEDDGTEQVTASVDGQSAKADVYINNPCSCPTTLKLTAAPTTINIEGTSLLLAYAEEGGAPITTGRVVWMNEADPKRGVLEWVWAHLGPFNVTNEETAAINEVSGVTQCEVEMFATAVTGVYLKGPDDLPSGSNLLASFAGKIVNLNTFVATGTALLVSYVSVGGAVNPFKGKIAGTARITAYMASTREAGLQATTDVTVEDPDDEEPPEPPECCDETCEVAPFAGGEVAHDVTEGDGFEDGETVTGGASGTSGTVKGLQTYPDDRYLVFSLISGDGWRIGETLTGGNTGTKAIVKKVAAAGEGGGMVTCPAGTRCCEHYETGETNCWPEDQCSDAHDGDGGGDGDGGHDTPWDPGKPKPPSGSCAPANCSANPTEECLAARFAVPLSLGCTCEQICQAEQDIYGTNQAYDGASMRTLKTIVIEDDGLEYNTPEYWEKLEERQDQAMSDCRDQCGDCETADPLVISGSDAVTSNGSYQYTASGGISPYTWAVSGEGASIDQNGLVTLSGDACGGFTVTVTDTCAASDSLEARVTDNGYWNLTSHCSSPYYCLVWGGCSLITGFTKRDESHAAGCPAGCCVCGNGTLTSCDSGVPTAPDPISDWNVYTWTCY
jgi:hypothetical protein